MPEQHISAGKTQARQDRRRRHLHQAGPDRGRLGSHPGPGRLQARYNRLVRRFGGDKNPGARKKAITAIAHTLLKIAYQVLKSGAPCTDLGADFCTWRESPAQQQAYLERRLQKLHPGCTITITISPPEAALSPGA